MEPNQKEEVLRPRQWFAGQLQYRSSSSSGSSSSVLIVAVALAALAQHRAELGRPSTLSLTLYCCCLQYHKRALLPSLHFFMPIKNIKTAKKFSIFFEKDWNLTIFQPKIDFQINTRTQISKLKNKTQFTTEKVVFGLSRKAQIFWNLLLKDESTLLSVVMQSNS